MKWLLLGLLFGLIITCYGIYILVINDAHDSQSLLVASSIIAVGLVILIPAKVILIIKLMNKN